MSSATERLLGIKPEERLRAAVMFLLYMGLVSAGFVVGRTIATSLFLQRLPRDFLPYTYPVVAVAVGLASAGYSRLSHRMSRQALFQWTLGICVVGLVLFRGALVVWPDALLVLGLLYVFVDVVAILSVAQFWTLACEVFSTREARRVFSVIGCGGMAGMLLFGALTKSLVGLVGTVNLLFLMVGQVVVCLVLLRRITRIADDRLKEASGERPDFPDQSEAHHKGLMADIRRLLRYPHLRSVALITMVMAVVVTTIDCQWKMSARYRFLGNEDGLTEYFSMYYLAVGLLSFLIQFFVTGRVIQRLGILVPLMMLPVTLVATGGVMLLASARYVLLWTSTASAAATSLLRFTMQNTAVQLFFRPVPADFRPRAQAIIEGVLRPSVTGLTGLGIAAALQVVRLRTLTWGVLVLLAVWIVLNLRARRHYLDALTRRIHGSRLDLDGVPLKADETTVRVIRTALTGGDSAAAFNALELVHSIPERYWGEDVAALLSSDHAPLRCRALEYLGDSNDTRQSDSVLRCIDDPCADVRVTAVLVTGRLLAAASRPVMNGLLQDPDARIAAVAAASILQHSPGQHADPALEVLTKMATDPDFDRRAAAAKALGDVSLLPHGNLLSPLLMDPAVSVRIAAMESAGKLGWTTALPALLDGLGDPRTARIAAEALVRLREGSRGFLLESLGRTDLSLLLLRRIPRVLSSMDDADCAGPMLDRMATRWSGLRADIAAAVGRIARKTGWRYPDTAILDGLLWREVREFFQCAVIQAGVRAEPGTLLYESFEERKGDCLATSSELLAIRYPGPHLQAVLRGMGSHQASVRSEAIELLDNTVEGELRSILVAAFEWKDVGEQVSLALRVWPEMKGDGSTLLLDLIQGEDLGIAACAIHAAGERNVLALKEELVATARAGNPFLAQTALGALRRLLPREELMSVASSVPSHRHPLLAQWAADCLRRKDMLTVVEKSLILKKVDLFRRIPVSVLHRIAEIASQEFYDEATGILRQGEAGKGLFVLIKGTADVVVDGRQVARLGPMDCFGEMSLFDSEPTSASVSAVTPVELLVLDARGFSDLMAERPEVSQGLISMLIRRLRMASQQQRGPQ
jgi:AAA family ATP:ADP antiporter